MSQLILINSKDRAQGDNNKFIYNFEIHPPYPAKKFRVNKITIPYSFNSTIAQTFNINWGLPSSLTPYQITIPAGTYNSTTIVNTINDAIVNSIGANELEIVFDSVQNKFRFQAINNFNRFQLDWNTNNLPPNQFYKSVGRQLGFHNGETYTINPEALNLTAPFFPNLTPTNNIYIGSNYLSIKFPSFFIKKRSTIIQSVLLNVNPSEFINFENQSPTYFPLNNSNTLSSIDLALYDDWGELIPLDLNWSIEIEIYF